MLESLAELLKGGSGEKKEGKGRRIILLDSHCLKSTLLVELRQGDSQIMWGLQTTGKFWIMF